MKIVIDCRYIRSQPSGIGAYVEALVRRLPTLAPDADFELWRNPTGPERLSPAPNVRQLTVANPANSLATLAWPGRLGPLDAETVFHSPHNILGVGVPGASVVTVHDLMWLEAPWLCDDLLPRRLVRQAFFGVGIANALRRATRILTVSHASADAILRRAPWLRGRLHVAPNAADQRFAPPADEPGARARAAAILGTDAPFFLLVGQNQPSKAHGLALRAFAAAARAGERIVLVQRQRPRRGLDALAHELGVADRVIWRGALAFDDLLTLLQAATALVQPSLAEGFGMPALEAMAAGCPVIASDIPPLCEILGGAGLHVPAGDGAALARALRAVADDGPRRAEMKAHGLAQARRYSWDDTAAIVMATYREAAAMLASDGRRRALPAPHPCLQRDPWPPRPATLGRGGNP